MTLSITSLNERFQEEHDKVILVTEVTRMNQGLVCVAGLEIRTGRMLRPLMGDGSNWPEIGWVNSGYMVVGNVLGLKAAAQAVSDYPHRTEDFRVANVKLLGQATTEELFQSCVETASENVNAIFGGNVKNNKFVEANTNCASLGCVIVRANRIQLIEDSTKLRISIPAGFFGRHELALTDLQMKALSVDQQKAAIRGRIDSSGGKVAIRIGLARAWGGNLGYVFDPKRCYLQANGVIVA